MDNIYPYILVITATANFKYLAYCLIFKLVGINVGDIVRAVFDI